MNIASSVNLARTMFVRGALISSLFLLLQACVLQQPSSSQQTKPTQHAAAIATAHPLATAAGELILKQGGNAFDAAVAVTAALAVVEPYGSGIGGGGFWLLHHQADGRQVMVDGRERAPLSAHRDMYLDDKGDVIARASIDGPLSAGIPGVPAALEHIAENYGRLPLSQLLQPAIELAQRGFAVDDYYIRMAGFRQAALQASEDAAKIFLHVGKVPEVGYVIRQPDLAQTLQQISAYGANGFYRGEVARKLVTSVTANGGIWTLDDLSQYNVVEREPVRFQFNGMTITSVPPPSSGGVALAQIFNMLAANDYLKQNAALQQHLIIESMRRAYRDRAEYLGDSDYVEVPVSQLISSAHAKAIAADIQNDAATPSKNLSAVAVDKVDGADTTHFSILDNEGNRVSATLSINYPFGSGFVAQGTGVLLNDEMDDFSSRPGTPNVYGLVGAEANAIQPGKRMLSSMSPSFAETEDRVAILGTPGGSRIITMVLLGLLEFYEGNDVNAMVDTPRMHHQYLPDSVFYEPEALAAERVKYLQTKGHQLKQLDSTYGNMQAIVLNKKTGKVEAAADKRGVGQAKVIP